MFTPGDYVVYSIEGVCRVEEAGRLNVPGLERGRDYYRLTPYYRGGVIYTPVGGKASIRPVMTKTALQALLPELPVSATELRSWKTAEEMLHQEFAFVLGKQPSEIKAYLEDAFAS